MKSLCLSFKSISNDHVQFRRTFKSEKLIAFEVRQFYSSLRSRLAGFKAKGLLLLKI